MSAREKSRVVHASTVALCNKAVLILGPSGSGKSTLALDLMSRGATLVSDDQTVLCRREDILFAAPPAAIAGRIEARGVGLLAAETTSPVAVALAVDLGLPEPDRMPPLRHVSFLDVDIDVVFGKENPGLAGAIHALLKGARVA